MSRGLFLLFFGNSYSERRFCKPVRFFVKNIARMRFDFDKRNGDKTSVLADKFKVCHGYKRLRFPFSVIPLFYTLIIVING